MLKQTAIIAVDWGTTNRRTYGIAGDGTLTDELKDNLGIAGIEPAGFPTAIAGLRARFGDAPMIMAGMIGSNRGLVEVPYLDCPADVTALAANMLKVTPHAVMIVPGLRYFGGEDADVMRGEEVQFVGAVAAGLIEPDATACHPGTHAKWAMLRDGAVTAFRTVMTGELFALLKTHSILALQLRSEAKAAPSFAAGVQRSLDHCELTADLFRIRARGLLSGLSDDDASSYASGLLIGADIKIGLSFTGRPGAVALIGDPVLTALYATALAIAGRNSIEIDGRSAFLAGIQALARRL